jgi:branched-chain amino acid transport system substrate-binding protein
MSSNPATTAGRSFVFRLAFLDNVQGDVLARFAGQVLRAGSAAVLYDVSTAYSRDLAERFRAAFIAGGGRVVAFESYTGDQATDFQAQLGRIRAARPDVLLLPNFPDAVRTQVTQFQQAGIRARLLGGDSWDPQTLPPLAAGVEAFVTNQWRPDIPTAEARRFSARYRDVFGAEPRATAAMTYDAVAVLLDAIRRAATLEGDSIRKAIAATKDRAGVSGSITYDGTNDPRRAVAVSRVRAGGLETVRLIEP